MAQWEKNLPLCRRCGFSPWRRAPGDGNGNPLQDSSLSWETPWTEELGRLQTMGSQELDTTLIRSEINKGKKYIYLYIYPLLPQKNWGFFKNKNYLMYQSF